MRTFINDASFWGALILSMAPLAVTTKAQTAETAVPQEFEVASVKLLSEPGGFNSTLFVLRHGMLSAEYAELRQLIGVAYDIQRVRVEGGPGWMDSDRYEILGKAASPDASDVQLRAMLQKLLAERFKLVVHRSTKDLTTYTLVPGKKGSTLQQVKEDEPGRPSMTRGTGNTAGK
jgi:uncharacterized protein (TIGR03435 family)